MGDQTTLKRVSLDLGHSHIRTSPNWQKTQAPSGRKHPNLIEEDLENLAVKWLEGGKGEELWPSNGGREDVTLRWSTDDKEITPKVKGIFVASWKLWRSRNRGKATTATQTNTAMNGIIRLP